MPFLEVNGKSLFIARADPHESGQKEPAFIFIHGLGSSHSFYMPLMAQLANSGYSSIAFDTHGSGLSELKQEHEPTSIESIAKDVEAIIQHAGLSPKDVIAVGHSMGAIVVSELAAKLDLRAAVLIGPVLPKPALAQIFKARIETVKKSGMEAMADTIPSAATGSKSSLTQKAFIRSLILSQTPEGYNSLCGVIAEAGRPSYSSARCPLLILAGEEDKTSPMTDAQVIHDEWGCKTEDKSIRILEGVGHWHCIEAADEVGTSILEFI